MPDLPADAITAAAEAIAGSLTSLDPFTGGILWPDLARVALEAAAPALRAQGAEAERERLIAVISPERFHQFADWFDEDDRFKEAMFPDAWGPGSRQDDVQQDLRRFADLLDGGGDA